MKQDSSKNYLASMKLIVFLNICFPCKNYAVRTMKIKGLSKKYYPVIMLGMPWKNESITILKKKKVIKQAASK